MLCEICIHLCRIIVFLSIYTYHRIELLQINFPKLVKLHFNPIEKCLCLTLHYRQGFLGEVGEEGANVYNLLGNVNVIAIPGGEQAKSLPILLEFVQIISRLWGFDGFEVIQNSLKGFLDLPLLPSQGAQGRHPFFFIRNDKWDDSCAISQWIDPLYFFVAFFLHHLNI